MKKILKTLVELTLVLGISIVALQFTAIAGYLPLPDETTRVFEEGNVPTPPGLMDTDVPLDGFQWTKLMFFNALSYAKVIVGVLGVLFITILGYRLLTDSDEEETITKAKRAIVYVIIALAIVSMSEDIGRLFDMEKSSLLSSPQEILNRVHIFDKEVEIVITFIKYILGTYAVMMVVRSAVKLITAGGNEEETTKHKHSILYSGGGLILIYIGDVFVEKVFYKIDKSAYTGITGVHPSIDAQEGVAQLIGITNFIVSFVGPIAILMLIIGAIMYVTAGGEEEKVGKAKRVLIATGLGIVIIYGAFALVSTVITGNIGPEVIEAVDAAN